MSGPSGTGPERMSDVEALMWSLEADPHLSSTFANLTMLDRAPDPERLRRRLWRASRVVPRLRRRVVDGVGPLPPTWEDDPAFDLDRHLRFVELPPGATDADARRIACEIGGDAATYRLDARHNSALAQTCRGTREAAHHASPRLAMADSIASVNSSRRRSR